MLTTMLYIVRISTNEVSQLSCRSKALLSVSSITQRRCEDGLLRPKLQPIRLFLGMFVELRSQPKWVRGIVPASIKFISYFQPH
jgi:hypothetical protein